MSFNFVKHIPWILPVVAIGAVGVVGSGALVGTTDSADRASAGTAAAAVNQPADNATVAALAAVTAATTPPAPAAPVEPATTSEQIAALLQDPPVAPQDTPVAADVDVTRSSGFAVSSVQEVTDPDVQAPVEPAALEQTPVMSQVDASFFNAAQAVIAQAGSCLNDLNNLAAQARVYFPSGALTGEDDGIAQARLIGTIAQNCPGVHVQVLGHSDPSGDPEINLQLSQSRAEAVVARVAAAGIDTSNLVPIGMGDRVPSGMRGVEEPAYYDRRVEFAIVEGAAIEAGPTFGAATAVQLDACVGELEDAVRTAAITYAPGSVTVSREDLDQAIALAQMAADCPHARLRLVGHHEEADDAFESPATARLRAIAVMTSLVGEGFEADQLIMAAPSESQPVEGLSNSRVDFDVLLEEL